MTRRLFDGYRQLPAIVEAGVEAGLGTINHDGDAARLTLGCYEVFAGDAQSPGAHRLVETAARPCELVFGNDPAWRRLIQDVYGSAVRDRPMIEFEADALDHVFLQSLARASDVVPMTAALAAQLDSELEPHALQVFESPEHFVSKGAGFGVVEGERLVAAATSYTLSPRYVEIAIATRPEYRGRGLATTLSAALMLQTLETGRVPCWSASNPVSQRLARRLGYRDGPVCEILLLSEA